MEHSRMIDEEIFRRNSRMTRKAMSAPTSAEKVRLRIDSRICTDSSSRKRISTSRPKLKSSPGSASRRLSARLTGLKPACLRTSSATPSCPL